MNELDNLDHLAHTADSGALELDAATAPREEGAPAPGEAPPDFETEARGAVDLFAAMVTGYAPAAESVWTDAAKHRTASALAPVMQKYGFTFGALPPEVTLVVVAGPMLWQTSKIIASQAGKDKAEKQAQDAARTIKEGSNIERAAQAKPEAPELLQHPQMALYSK